MSASEQVLRTDTVSSGGERASESALTPQSTMLTAGTAGLGAAVVQRKLARRLAQRKASGAASAQDVHEQAAQGVQAGGGSLPHLDTIQRSFGGHDVSGVSAHVGGAAATAAEGIGAEAYAVGSHVAFRSAPDLHTAAHEAAHVVQQRGGVQLKDGVGQSGDAYEQHADAVADAVVQGRSAETLLSQHGGQQGVEGAVQRQDDVHSQNISETTDTGNKYTQELELNKTSHRVQIQLGVHWEKKGTWASDDAFWKWVRWVKTTVYGHMDNKFKIVCTPQKDGKAVTLPIDFLIYDIDDGYKIECHGQTHGRSAMTQAGGKLFELGQDGETALPAITPSHEFGHCMLGASDEYANPALPDRKISNDHSIMGNFYTQGIDKAEYKVRHFAHILKEVAAQYPGYTCKLEAM